MTQFTVTYWPGTASLPAHEAARRIKAGETRIEVRTIEAADYPTAQQMTRHLMSTSDGCLITPQPFPESLPGFTPEQMRQAGIAMSELYDLATALVVIEPAIAEKMRAPLITINLLLLALAPVA